MVPLPLKFVLLVCIIACAATAYGAIDWKPVNPQDLSQNTPLIENGAHAEALFWNIWVDDKSTISIFTHYVRVKIFTARGVESQSRIDLPYFGRDKVTEIAARTIKPDGSIVELKKDKIFERTLIKAGKAKVESKSFVLPGVEPGAIVEYQWREERAKSSPNLRLDFQREIPVRSVKYYVKPFSSSGLVQSFNMQNIPLVKEKEGYSSLSLSNVPAFLEEPRMPPEAQVRPWVLFFYGDGIRPERYWAFVGQTLFKASNEFLKIDNDIKRAAIAVIGDATTPEEKLRRLFDFCRSKITNPYDDASGYSLEDLLKLKENKFPSDTLKRGLGSDLDIDSLFTALAIAAGFDARLVLVPDRGDFFFEISVANSYFLTRWDVAVKTGTEWRFFNPSNRYATFGMLDWREEGQPALLPDVTDAVWIQTPLSPAGRSLMKRTARLKLAVDGTLEGDVEIVYTGHFAVDEKEFHDSLTATEQAEQITNGVKEHMSTADVSAVTLESVKDTDKPLTLRFHVRVPQYAPRTGTRLFLQPGFFQRGQQPLFASSTRTYPIYFHYPWSEQDEVSIELPAGFEIENGEAPSPVRISDVTTYEVRMQLVRTGELQSLKYQRTMSFGLNGNLLFPLRAYNDVKTIFDAFHQRDEHTLTLKTTPVRQ